MSQSDGRGQASPQESFPIGGGKLGGHIRSRDWAQTPMGPIDAWPVNLRVSLQNVLNTAIPAMILWGEDSLQLYNDAYLGIADPAYIEALGQPARDGWGENWNRLSPLIDAVRHERRTICYENKPFVYERSGVGEETFFTTSYGPILDPRGKVDGILMIVIETTGEVISQRRLRTMRNVGLALTEARDPRDVLRRGAAALWDNPNDLPFVLIYAQQTDATRAELMETVRMDVGTAWSPKSWPPGTADEARGPFGLTTLAAEGELVDLTMPSRPPTQGLKFPTPTSALVLPLNVGQGDVIAGYLVFGLNPLVRFNEDYQDLLTSLAKSISRAYTAAHSREAELDMVRVQAELVRQRAKAQHLRERAHILDSIGDPFFAVDRHWKFTYINEAAHRFAERPSKDLRGRQLWEAFPQLKGTQLERTYREAMATGEPKTVEFYDAPADEHFHVHVYPWERGLSMVFRHVTEQVRIADALQRSEARLRAVAESTLDVIAITDAHGVFTYLSPCAQEVLARPIDELQGQTIFDLFSPEAAHRLRGIFTRLLQEHGARSTFMESITTSNGQRWLSGTARNLFGIQGIEGIFVNLRDVTEMKDVEDKLIAAKEEAEEVTRLKSSLLANMSHEIRTPLTSIMAMASLLAREVPPEHHSYAQAIERSGKRLAQTLDSVLTLAQLEGQAIEPRVDIVDLLNEVDQAIESLERLAAEKGLALVVEGIGEPVIARVDATLLAGVLNNLIGNAIKFTPQGTITIRVNRDQDHGIIEVSDTGIGISEEFLPHVFNEFSQESTGLARAHEGTGLGLAIARRVVEAMGGSISVESTPGQGSTFRVCLPRRAPIREPHELLWEATAPASSRVYAAYPQVVEAPSTPQTSTNGQPARVLIVEDDEMIRTAVERLLKNEFQVVAVGDAESALDSASQQDFDLVLLDVGLPGMSGVEALHRLRALPRYEHRPAVALTGYAMPGDRRGFLDEGFTEYLAKPFASGELLELVHRLV